MENTNWSDDSIRVVWEILSGDNEHIFEEITTEEIGSNLWYPDFLVNTEQFPTIPYPLINPDDCCLDRVWTQKIIKIKPDVLTTGIKKDQESKRVFDINENNKGLVCPFKLSRCQEGWCQGCCIYLNRS